MTTTVKISYEGRMQMALVEYDVRYGKPVIVKVKIGLKDVTDEIGYMNRSKIKIAINEDCKMRAVI